MVRKLSADPTKFSLKRPILPVPLVVTTCLNILRTSNFRMHQESWLLQAIDGLASSLHVKSP